MATESGEQPTSEANVNDVTFASSGTWDRTCSPVSDGRRGSNGSKESSGRRVSVGFSNRAKMAKRMLLRRGSFSSCSTDLYFWRSEAMGKTNSRRPSVEKTGLRLHVSKLVNHRFFDVCMCTLVVANSITIGLEQAWRLEGRATVPFDLLEHVFLSIFIVELGLRFFDGRLAALQNNWVRFDIMIVLVGVVTNWVLVPIYGEIESVGSLLVLRMCRLLRIARMLKLVVRCRELMMLVQGLMNSVGTMFYTFVLCMILFYVVGCMSMELIPLAMRSREDIDPAVLDIIDNHFRSLPVAMLSMVQFITFDNVVYIYKPLIEEDATLAIFFMAVILGVGVVFMNLVTAVIVNSGLEQAMQDKDIQKAHVESKRKKLINNLKQAFIRADTDGSGEITREELNDISEEDKDLLRKVLGVDDLMEIFDCLDVDGDGELGIEEFCKGIERIVASETSKEFKRMERLMNSMHKQLKEAKDVQEDLRKSVHAMAKGLDPSSEDTMTTTDGSPDVEAPEETANPEKTVVVVRPLPAWAGQLVAELKEVCVADIRCAMDNACRSVLSELCDAALSRPTTPPVTLTGVAEKGWCNDARSECSSSHASPRVATPPDQWAHFSAAPPQRETRPATRWEVLPPAVQLGAPPAKPSSRDRAVSDPAQQRPGGKPSGSQAAPPQPQQRRDGKTGKPSRPPPVALNAPSASSRLLRSPSVEGLRAPAPLTNQPPSVGGFVPESGKPTLLCRGAATDDAVGADAAAPRQPWLRKEEL